MGKEETAVGAKSPGKIPAAKRATRKKPKDKPKRPLSAYNFFFKEEREKILKLLAGNEDVENDPSSDDYITPEALDRLRKNGKDGPSTSPKFEELGKLIGQRWKALPPDRLTKYSELASEDAERYKKEMHEYNGRQEAKMREEALNKPTATYPMPGMKAPGAAAYGTRAPQGYYDMGQMGLEGMAYTGQPQLSAHGYGYTADSYAYPPSMAAMYGGYAAYPGMADGSVGGVMGGNSPGVAMMGMAHPGDAPPTSQFEMVAPSSAAALYGMAGGSGGYQGMVYGGSSGGPAQLYDPNQGMYGGYVPGPGWSGHQ